MYERKKSVTIFDEKMIFGVGLIWKVIKDKNFERLSSILN